MGLKNVLKTASMGVREMDAERLTTASLLWASNR